MRYNLQLNKLQSSINDLLNQEKIVYLLVFLTAFLIRLLPELIIPSYPVGYETITFYAPALIEPQNNSGILFYDFTLQFLNVNQTLSNTLRAGPIFYFLMFVIVQITGANGFLTLKILGPVLYGFLALSFYFFLVKSIKLEKKTALLTTIFLIFQIASLRLAWDRFRTVLGLIFFFYGLILIPNRSSLKNWISLSIIGIASVLSRDYIGFLFLIVSFGYSISEKKDFKKFFVFLSPVIIILLLILNPGYLNWNYLSNNNFLFYISNYFFGVQDSLLIFAICYLLMLPLIIKGFFKNNFLDPMLIWLLLGSFSLIFVPWFSIPGYQRWLMLLTFPFTIYAIKGLKYLNMRKHKTKIVTIVLSLFIGLGVIYSSGIFSYIGLLPNSYVPIKLTQSSIPWDEVDDVKFVLNWLDSTASTNSTLLSEERFFGWVQIYLERDTVDIEIIDYIAGGSPLNVIEKIKTDQVYMIWYKSDVILGFDAIYSKNNITIFEYVST